MAGRRVSATTTNVRLGEQRRDDILRYLLSFGPDQWMPSVRQIGEAVGLASPSTTLHHLRRLERDKVIVRGPGDRQIRVLV